MDLKTVNLLWIWFGHGLIAILAIWALKRGGFAERLGALIILTGWILTPIVQEKGNVGLDPGTTLVDLAVFALLAWLSLKTRELWLIVASASMLLGIFGHTAAQLSGAVSLIAYITSNGFWSGYMLLAALAAGMVSVEMRRAAIRNQRP